MVCVHLWKGLLISSVIVREIAMCWPVGEGGRRQGMPNRRFEGKGWNRLGTCKGTCNIKQTMGAGGWIPNTKGVPSALLPCLRKGAENVTIHEGRR